MSALTDIQKAMIKQICEGIAPPGNNEVDKFYKEAELLAKFFYSNTEYTGDIVSYMQELGYVPAEVVLEYPDLELPSVLSDRAYGCEVHCYYEPSGDLLFKKAIELGLVRISANKINREKNILFPAKQTFYVSCKSDLDKMLEEVIENNKISSVKVGLPFSVNWEDFYNIRIDDVDGHLEVLNYHKVKDHAEG